MPEDEKKCDEVDVRDEEDVEATPVVARKAPKEPTEEERLRHLATHLPYRSWCEHCVKGRARKTAHGAREKEEKGEDLERVTKIYFDFYYYGGRDDGVADDEDEREDSPAVVMLDGRTGAVASWMIRARCSETMDPTSGYQG